MASRGKKLTKATCTPPYKTDKHIATKVEIIKRKVGKREFKTLELENHNSREQQCMNIF